MIPEKGGFSRKRVTLQMKALRENVRPHQLLLQRTLTC